PALMVLVDLRSANSCEAKKALLPRAKENGDERVLPVLRKLQNAQGCGFLGLSECWGCLHRDNALGTTIEAIEERTKK
ncbi:MAG TPA: hypothetical protein VF881_15585, partial [Polyangiaceae bacterium]